MTYAACLPFSLEKVYFGGSLFQALRYAQECRRQGFEATLMALVTSEDLKWYAKDRLDNALR